MKYPVRCKIIDIAGFTINDDYPEIVAATPDISKPHIGKLGLAEKMLDGNVRITLDDGEIMYGYQCWWIPVMEEL